MGWTLFFVWMAALCFGSGESAQPQQTINLLVDQKNPTFQLNIITDPDEFPGGVESDVRIGANSRIYLPQFQDDQNLIPEIKREFETVLSEMAQEAKSEIEAEPVTTQLKESESLRDEEKKLQEDVREMFEEMTFEMDRRVGERWNWRRNEVTAEDDKELELRQNLAVSLQSSVKLSIDNSGLDESSKNLLSSMLRKRMSRLAGKVIGKFIVRDRRQKQKAEDLRKRQEERRIRDAERRKKNEERRRKIRERNGNNNNQENETMKHKWAKRAQKKEEKEQKKEERAQKKVEKVEERKKKWEERKAKAQEWIQKKRSGMSKKTSLGRETDPDHKKTENTQVVNDSNQPGVASGGQ